MITERTRKGACRHFIMYGNSLFKIVDYPFRSRKEKKRIKRHVEKRFYWDSKRRRYCFYHPKLLSTPIPKEILNSFRQTDINIPIAGPLRRFRRYESPPQIIPL